MAAPAVTLWAPSSQGSPAPAASAVPPSSRLTDSARPLGWPSCSCIQRVFPVGPRPVPSWAPWAWLRPGKLSVGGWGGERRGWVVGVLTAVLWIKNPQSPYFQAELPAPPNPHWIDGSFRPSREKQEELSAGSSLSLGAVAPGGCFSSFHLQEHVRSHNAFSTIVFD